MSEIEGVTTVVRERRRRRRITGFVVAGVAMLAGAWLWSFAARLPNVSHLSPASRKALYTRTLSDLELCNRSEGRMVEAHCDHQAEFILNFEECDGACKALSARWRRVAPTK